MGKILVIEGTDCSGKETQSKKLMDNLKSRGYKVSQMSFPVYDSPTGKIVGGPFLGKKYICDGWFDEKAPNVDWKVASLYYAADRKYHLEEILKAKNDNDVLVLDRYVYSNMGHQVSKLETKEKRKKGFKWIEDLEFGLLELPKPDISIFLHMPYKGQVIIKANRDEALDQNESDKNACITAEETFLEMADLYNFNVIECMDGDRIKSIDEVSKEVNCIVDKLIKEE